MRSPGVCCGAAALVLFAGAAVGQVQINSGQTLTESDLNAGVFMGQPFTLGAGTTFEVNSGGAIAPVGAPGAAYDFNGSVVNVNAGGSLLSQLLDRAEVTGLLLRVFDGGALGQNFVADDGCEFDVWGGTVGRFFSALDGSVVRIHGGEIGGSLAALGGSDVLVAGGSLGAGVTVNNGGLLTVDGGQFVSGPRVRGGGEMIVRGGSLGRGLSASDGSLLTLEGGEFELDGAPVVALPGGLPASSTLAGTLRDGTVLVLSGAMGDAIAPGALALVQTALPPVDTTPMVVMDGDGPETGLRAGQTLTVTGDGALRDRFEMIDATLIVEDGGFGGDGLEAVRGDLRILGDGPGHIGALGDDVVLVGSDLLVDGGVTGGGGRMLDGGTLELREGTIGENWTLHGVDAHVPPQVEGRTGNGQPPQPTQFIGDALELRDGATMVVEAGVIGDGLDVLSGSSLVVEGGLIGEYASVLGGQLEVHGGVFEGTVTIGEGAFADVRGGTFGDRFEIANSGAVISGGVFGRAFVGGGTLELRGGEFSVNGAPAMSVEDFDGLDRAFAGTLSDGTVFVASWMGNDVLGSQTVLTETALPPVDTTPIVVDGDSEAPAGGLRPGQTMMVVDDGLVRDKFASHGATVEVHGGEFGSGSEFYDCDLVVTGGEMDGGPHALHSVVRLEGGRIRSSASSSWRNWFGLIHSDFEATGGDVVGRTGARHSAMRVFDGASMGEVSLWDSTLEIDGGIVGSIVAADSYVELNRGEIEGDVSLGSGGSLRVMIGDVGGRFHAGGGSSLEFLVLAATLEGVQIQLSEGVPIEIGVRDRALLELELVGGAVIDIELDQQQQDAHDYISSTTTLTLTLGGAACFVDLNGSGAVDFPDLHMVLAQYGLVGFGYAADLNDDGVVGFDDLLEVLVRFGEECG